MSSEAIYKDQDALKTLADELSISPDDLKAEIEDGLNSWKSDSFKGPNVLFKPPHSLDALAPNHPFKTRNLAMVKIDIDRLLEDYPDTIIHGSELEPYDDKKAKKLGDSYADIRHRRLSREELNYFRGMSAYDIWKEYGEDDGAGRYAPNVPHASIQVPGGIIPPEYLTLKRIESQKNRRYPSEKESSIDR